MRRMNPGFAALEVLHTVKEEGRFPTSYLVYGGDWKMDTVEHTIREIREEGRMEKVLMPCQVLTLPLQQDFFPEQSASSLPVYL